MKVSKKLPMIQEIINVLEKYGYEVYLSHHNFGEEGAMFKNITNPVSHVTELTVSDGDYEWSGYAACSIHDQFDRAKGTYIAFMRLMEGFLTDIYDNNL